MIVSTILLSANNCYVDKDGNLPTRPEFDKELLATLLKGQAVSVEGYNMLPPSLKNLCFKNVTQEPYPITIPEIDALSDLLIVSRSNDYIVGGKEFRFDNFTLLVKQPLVAIYKRK